MKSFLRNTLYFALPIIIIFIIIISIYLIGDPFKVIKKYDAYYEPETKGCVEVNKGYLSLMNFNSHKEEIEFNSFIFGSSRSMFYQVDDWKNFLDQNDICYHFDASSEDLKGMYEKVKYVYDSGLELKNVLFVIDYSVFEERKSTTHLNIISPQLVEKENIIEFHLLFLKAFLNIKFLIAYIDYSFFGEVRSYMNCILETKPFHYEYRTNEVKFVFYENLIENDEYYTPNRMKSFFERNSKASIMPSLIDDENEEMLNEIYEIFDICNTNFKIIISPLYAQTVMSESDLNILDSIFGTDNIYNYSGKNAITEDYRNYYENSHYRPHVALKIMKIVYNSYDKPKE